MNCKIGIIATSLLVSSLAAPAWAGLSEPAAAGGESAGHPLSAPENSGGQTRIDSFLNRFAGIASSDPSSENTHTPLLAIDSPISETTLFSAFTRAGSHMNAYYSRTGSDNKETIAALSRSSAFVTAFGGDRFEFPEARLAAFVEGHYVGSGAVASGADIAPIHSETSGPTIIQPNCNDRPCIPRKCVPLPLPFFLTGSGLAALLALKKKAGING